HRNIKMGLLAVALIKFDVLVEGRHGLGKFSRFSINLSEIEQADMRKILARRIAFQLASDRDALLCAGDRFIESPEPSVYQSLESARVNDQARHFVLFRHSYCFPLEGKRRLLKTNRAQAQSRYIVECDRITDFG